MVMPFRDRVDAGRQLAALVKDRVGSIDAIVLGLARGGVPVAAEVARALHAPLDVMVARKIGAPGQPEFGIGAIAPGVRVLDARSVALVGASTEVVDQIATDEEQEMQRRFLAYRGDPAPPDVHGKLVILVDDGLATGVTARAAIGSLRKQGPRRIVLAAPVGAAEAVQALMQEADDVLVLEAPEDFRAVGVWYDDFRQTTDDEVLALLRPRAPRPVTIPAPGGVALHGDLVLPEAARGIVVFAHGSGSSRSSPRNRFVAGVLQRAGLGTLLLDLLTAEEERVDERTRELRFDIDLLAERFESALAWVAREVPALRLGAFGSSTGAAAALITAARRPDLVAAVVSRGGRPDLAGDALPRVVAPTLLLVGGRDEGVIELNEDALARLRCKRELVLIAGATHLFEEPGTLDEVAHVAAEWFGNHFGSLMVTDPRS